MILPTDHKKPSILLVEDNPDDQELAYLAFGKIDKPCTLHIADDGIHAMDLLNQAHRRSSSNLMPDLLLIDLAMPRMGGLEFLTAVNRQKHLASLPTVVFTTSTAQHDIQASYAAGCNSYITKPLDISGLAKIFSSLVEYWFYTVTLPGIKTPN